MSDENTSHLEEVLGLQRTAQQFVSNGNTKFLRAFPSFEDGLVLNSSFGRHLNQCLSVSMMNNKGGIAFVPFLLGLCSPAAIFFRVITIVVNSIYRMFIARGSAKILKEVLKLVPALTDLYSSSSIEPKCLASRIKASLSNSVPYSVFLGWRAILGFSVRREHLTKIFSTKAPATLLLSKSEIRGYLKKFFAAITTAKPATLLYAAVINRSRELNYKQFSESLAYKVLSHKQLLIEGV